MSGGSISAASLPRAANLRWQPLRMGLVNLYYYDDGEEFRFHDGHLLLRGNNGTGKSKVLALTLPFLFDAQLSASRVEPDGDRNKRMDWNLLLAGMHERRIGYSWIEFGRCDADGQTHYLTLGIGLHAAAGRPRVDSWHFITPQRIGEDLWLFTPEGAVLSRERLHDALGTCGQIFDTARDYRRAVDEQLFRLGERFDALIDTLIQLRQPQLSRKPDEGQLSDALTAALPPLPPNLLQEVADALSRLERYRAELTELEQLNAAVSAFGQRYRAYAQVQARRQARGLRQAQTAFDRASAELTQAREAAEASVAAAQQAAEAVDTKRAQLQRDRAAQEELAGDPLMQDARRLDELKVRARDAAIAAERAADAQRVAAQRASDEAWVLQERRAETDACRARRDNAAVVAEQAATGCGLAAEHLGHVEVVADEAMLADSGEAVLTTLEQSFARSVERRDMQVRQLRRRHAEIEATTAARERAEAGRGARAEQLDQAQQASASAEAALRNAVQDWRACWDGYLDGLREIRPADAGIDTAAVRGALADWAESQEGDHPLRASLQGAARSAGATLAAKQAAAGQRREAVQMRLEALHAEREGLEAGAHAQPAAPLTRAEGSRDRLAGAPLWQLVDFREAVPQVARGCIEAALQAAGLLDAWITPEGRITDAHRQDSWLVPRGARDGALSHWLYVTPDSAVDASVVEAMLAGIALGDADAAIDDGAAEAWIAADGRFRLGPLAGAWHKGEAEFIGFAAREAARQRRLQALAAEITEADAILADIDDELQRLAARVQRLNEEQAAMPGDVALHRAHAEASAGEARRREAQEALAEADAVSQRAENVWRRAREQLQLDAEDLRLPRDRESLETVATALADYRHRVQALGHVLQVLLRELREQAAQQARLATAQADLAARDDEARAAAKAREEAEARRAALEAAVGEQVAALQQRLGGLKAAVAEGESQLEVAQQRRIDAEKRAAAEAQKVEDRQQLLAERVAERGKAAEQLQAFAATGLLQVSVPALEHPAQWSVDPALNAARRIEQALSAVDDSDETWERLEEAVSRDYNALYQALTAHGHRAEAQHSRFGLVAHIIYGGRPRRPDELEALLGEEIASRREILTAREREVLESHLEREVAQHLQDRLREAEARVASINSELDARPTSTGVKFRLDWELRPEGEGGAPAGLTGVRERLVRRAAAAWSPEDRSAIGDFLKGCIDAERERDAGAPLADHLARALDYRHWHRFRVRRFAAGRWNRLTGPASGGERALGLTVPLFAAASAHYTSCGNPHAPRLVLLDEAFAGIDDEARAHCMSLIASFDLDFVMTSEREWGCYRELPGVAICQLLRRENVEAVHISRWRWDGASRQPEADPTRRTADAALAGSVANLGKE